MGNAPNGKIIASPNGFVHLSSQFRTVDDYSIKSFDDRGDSKRRAIIGMALILKRFDNWRFVGGMNGMQHTFSE